MSNEVKPAAYKTHGYHESVLRSHKSRTAEACAAYLLPSIRPDMNILDVGSPKGHVTGIDMGAEVLEHARANAEQQGLANITFQTGSVLELPFPDNTFDIVHAHQVIQHTTDQVKALQEMRRVTKDGGIVAVRDADMSAMNWFPNLEGLEEWRKIYMAIARASGGEPDAARRLHFWAKGAGFKRDQISLSTATNLYATAEEAGWWGNMWADRTMQSLFLKTATEGGYASLDEVSRIADVWRQWGGHEDAWFALLQGQMLCKVEKDGSK
ncbi:methyltransferase type 11 [Desarmillaria tabescens]|uniref:Methyltransferase type 11 n=1 Tax=Armillaria tabescens TaxID=1929756 RepID=A0AA39NK31_ARMTA|nr:methyltransferase type 11 [Desarmillaria tabescens]KAK0467065.1 methyltransferase type 11 [Desarmillaria tabescens]